MGAENWAPLVVQGLTILAGGGGVVYGTIQLIANRKVTRAQADNTGAGTLQIANSAVTGALGPLNAQIEFLGRQLASANATIEVLGRELEQAHAATRALRRDFDDLREAVADCDMEHQCPVRDAIVNTGSQPVQPEEGGRHE